MLGSGTGPRFEEEPAVRRWFLTFLSRCCVCVVCELDVEGVTWDELTCANSGGALSLEL